MRIEWATNRFFVCFVLLFSAIYVLFSPSKILKLFYYYGVGRDKEAKDLADKDLMS